MERKLATVLFVDLVDSTRYVSSTDPEVVRRRVNRFFEHASQCIERHGGIVEKFAGDAVMAAFGIPQAHEDDAERAIRAALAILEATNEVQLEARVGIEAGEVVVEESDSTFATGEAVNIAARLQQTADAGQVLIGPSAYRLTLDRVHVEDVGLLEIRGRSDPLWAWRVVGVVDGAARPHRVEAPLVGRDLELSLLEGTYARVIRNRRAHLVTIFGDPGVGKSRLAREFLETLEGATVLQGRSLPYGEGITYWPLAEMVKVSAGIHDDEPVREAFEKLRACCEDEAIADLLANASGVLEAVEAEATGQEIAWAAREWAAKLAEPQPLVLVFEDIHWAEEPLLELVEYLAEYVRDAPLLIICLARPELLEVRPSWGGGRLRSAAIELEPLAEDESAEMIDALLTTVSLDPACRDEILDVTEGNPLFVEETIRMLAERGSDVSIAEAIPNTLQTLIAARIDRLPAAEKRLVQRAALVGRIFWEGAVAHLSPELDDLAPTLESLVLRELVLPEARSSISGERAYKFKHVLIRDVAYSGLSKSERAAQHARFAAWLREHAGEELLEIRAFHLDKATDLLAELDGAPPAELVVEAAEALEAAGRRALSRESYRTARKLFLRSLELDPTLKRRYLATRAAWRLGDLPTVAREMHDVAAVAEQEGKRDIHGRALTALAEVTLFRDGDFENARSLAERALAVLPDDDRVARFDALMTLAEIDWSPGTLGLSKQHANAARGLARALGRKDLEAVATARLASTSMMRLELEDAEAAVTRIRELAEESGSVFARAMACRAHGVLQRVRGELDEAEQAFEAARALSEEAGVASLTALTLNWLAWVVWVQGNIDAAERHFRESIRLLKPLEDRSTLCESQRGLAELLVERGKLDEAERLAFEARETVAPKDLSSAATTTMTLGLVRAAQGRDAEAESLLREAVSLLEGTDFVALQIEPISALAEFLRSRGRPAEADEVELQAPANGGWLGRAHARRNGRAVVESAYS